MRRVVSANRGRPPFAGAEVVEAEEREVPDAAISRWRRGDRKETEEGDRGKRASGRWRRDVQSAGDPARTLANQRSPRAQCVAAKAVLHHVRVRWAVAGYKRLRPSGRPPFWGSFRGKFGCPVALEGNVLPRAVGRGSGVGSDLLGSHIFP